MKKSVLYIIAASGLASCGVKEPYVETQHFQCFDSTSFESDEGERQDLAISNLTVSELSKPFDRGELGTQIFYSDQLINAMSASNRDVQTEIVSRVRQGDFFNYQFVSSDGRSFKLSKDRESGIVELSSPDLLEQRMQCREMGIQNQD